MSYSKIKRPGIKYYFPHFRDRLFERYEIEITIDEYTTISNQPINLIYVLSSNKRFGSITIKGKEVLVIRCNASGLLNTALNIDKHLPVPVRYIKQGISIEEFNDDVQFALCKIDHLVQCIKEMKDNRKFFLTKPGGFPNWMYGAALSKAKGRTHHYMVSLVKNLYNNG